MSTGPLARLVGKNIAPRDQIKRWKILKGDTVQVMDGADKGKQGVVIRVIRKKNSLVVKGVNVTKRHVKKGLTPPEGAKAGYWSAEAPVSYSKVALLDPVDKKPTKVAWKFLENGDRVRVGKRTGNILPKPALNWDLRYRKIEGPKDTPVEHVLTKTFDEATLNPLKWASINHKTTSISEKVVVPESTK